MSDNGGINPAAEFRRLLDRSDGLIVPGAYDCVSALLLEQAGFEALYMTGYGAAASSLGLPDAGLITRTEMVMQAGRIASAIHVPLLSDADDGFGNPIGVMRTVREFERAGIAGIHIEDQKAPKRCGHVGGKQILTTAEMCQKIRAATEAHVDPAFVVIARVDSRAVAGLEDAIERGIAYHEAGADVIFVESPYSADEAKIIADRLHGVPLMWNSGTGRITDGGKTPWVEPRRLFEMGWKIVIFPAQTLWAAAATVKELAAVMRAESSYQSQIDRIMPFEEFNELIGLARIPELELAYEVR